MNPYDDPYNSNYIEKYDNYAFALDAILYVPAYFLADNISPFYGILYGVITSFISYIGAKQIYKHMPVLVNYISIDDLMNNPLSGKNLDKLHEQEIIINKSRESHAETLHEAEIIKRAKRSMTLYLYFYSFIVLYYIMNIFF